MTSNKDCLTNVIEKAFIIFIVENLMVTDYILRIKLIIIILINYKVLHYFDRKDDKVFTLDEDRPVKNF